MMFDFITFSTFKIDLISQDTLTCEIKERILLFHVNSHAFQGIFLFIFPKNIVLQVF